MEPSPSGLAMLSAGGKRLSGSGRDVAGVMMGFS
jgi:hypothetical protein